jgi:5-oxoprolinase (ATP-hydrolysing)
MDPDKAGIPLDREASESRFDELIDEMVAEGEMVANREELLRGLRGIAVETMAEAIRSVSVREGVEVEGHALLAFGGAGPQHAAAVAECLGMDRVLVPADAGLLSAWGLERSVRQEQAVRQVLGSLQASGVTEIWRELADQVRESLGIDAPVLRWLATIRLQGQEAALDVESPDGDPSLLAETFRNAYKRTFGYAVAEDRMLELVSLRVIGESRLEPVDLEEFGGVIVEGPSLIQDRFSTCVVPPGWKMRLGSRGTMLLECRGQVHSVAGSESSDAVLAGLFRGRFEGILDAMGEALKRTAVSTNVKDRMDYSCALLNADGQLVASAPHVPVHLGALGVCVREVCSRMELGMGDVIITNDPGAGGSHLPDVTVIAPIHDPCGCLVGFVANRAHHAELGGLAPGSMPAQAKCLEEEGVVIRPMKLVEAGVPWLERLSDLLRGASHPSRRPEDNLADAEAQLAACHFARDAILGLVGVHGTELVMAQLDVIVQRSARLMEQRLLGNEFDRAAATELDDGSILRVRIRSSGGRLEVDFSGSADVHPGNLNATPAIVRSVLLYVLRLWLDEDVPLNEGLLGPVEVIVPRGMLNPDFSGTPRESPAVVGGNVETSQRLADLLLEALDISAHGPGTMNNFLFGDGEFGYYETLAGGSGAGANHRGASGRHVHMTNTALTDPELMEQRYPVRVWNHALRRGSGGRGAHPGGDGIVREIEFLRPVTVSFLTQRRETSPKGLSGGEDGQPGKQTRIFPCGEKKKILGVHTYRAEKGERVRIETPGGGGWGPE